LRCILVIITISVLLTSCVGDGGAGGAGGGEHPPQHIYQVRIAANRGALKNGILTYPVIRELRVDESLLFRVKVMGAHAAQREFNPPRPGRTLDTKPTPIGGLVGVKLSCINIKCESSVTKRQNVLHSTDSAEWFWHVKAQEPGKARLILVATVYNQATTNPLYVSPPIEQKVSVTPTLSYYIQRIAGWVKSLIALLGAGAVGGAFMAIYRRLRKMREGQSEAGLDTPRARKP
jgi:hypothetical protein